MDRYFVKVGENILDTSDLRGIHIQVAADRYYVFANFYDDTTLNLFSGTKEACNEYLDKIYNQIDEYQRFVKNLWSEGAE